MRYRWAIRFAVEGDLRFISHRDSLRLFERALVRAQIPVRYSEGFNPRPRLQLPLPRPVGVASLDERLVVEVTQEAAPQAALARLAAEMPVGLTLLDLERIEPDDRRVPREAEYAVPIAPELRSAAERAATSLMTAERVPVTRRGRHPGADREVDIRPYLLSVCADRDEVLWRQRVGPGGSARIDEVLSVLGLPRDGVHRVVRRRVVYDA